jgi:hypothetical protein
MRENRTYGSEGGEAKKPSLPLSGGFCGAGKGALRIHGSSFRISNSQRQSVVDPSLRANGSRECAPDDRLREAIHHDAKKGWIASSLRSSQ